MKGRFVRIILTALSCIVLVLGLLITYQWFHWSPAGALYPGKSVEGIELPQRLRNSEEHDAARKRNGGNPYILSISPKDKGSLLYYGASHTKDRGHPQVGDITKRWQEFKPTVALYEGRKRNFFYGAIVERIAGLPEPTLVHKLARRDGVKLFQLEPSYSDEVAELLKAYKPEQVALYFFLRVYTSEAGGVANDSLAKDLLRKRTDVDGLRGSLSELSDVDRLWRKDFPGEKDWRVLQGEPGYLGEISVTSRRIRGEHMARILIDLVNKKERVLAVVGSGHVIRQEWNLRTVFGQEPAWDQPKKAE